MKVQRKIYCPETLSTCGVFDRKDRSVVKKETLNGSFHHSSFPENKRISKLLKLN